jgi:putative nucleotidyltransferase with HDIG domain
MTSIRVLADVSVCMCSGIEKTVVVVDDDEAVCMYLGDTLASEGYDCRMFSNGSDALGWLTAGKGRVDLLLSDINMPGMDGLALLRKVKAIAPDLPFILVSGLCDLPTAQGALRAGATDYMLKPVDPDDLLGLVSRHVRVVISVNLEGVKEALRRALATRDESGVNTAGALLPIFDGLGFKRFETLQHSQRVAAFALLIARDLRLDRRAHRGLEIGSLLHDIGKAGIPHNVLMKPGQLNEAERTIMVMHPRLGLDLLRGLPGLDSEAQLVYSHHERFDGTGYPQRLAGEAIPLSARIFSIADTLDAITSDRCYRRGRTISEARVEIHRASGSQFDPSIVELFDRVSDEEFETVRKRFPDNL